MSSDVDHQSTMTLLPKSNFTANLLALNRTGVSGFKKWLIKAGMAYGDQGKWWGGKTARLAGHEGLDFAAYFDREGKERQLGSGIVVPPLYRGRLIGLRDDFLGRTVIVAHDIITNHLEQILHGFYAHLIPATDLKTGETVSETAGLGTIAPGSKSCPSHLHISTVWITPGYPLEQFNWSGFTERDGFQPCDPLDFL